jgi:hypothetical protein
MEGPEHPRDSCLLAGPVMKMGGERAEEEGGNREEKGKEKRKRKGERKDSNFMIPIAEQ